MPIIDIDEFIVSVDLVSTRQKAVILESTIEAMKKTGDMAHANMNRVINYVTAELTKKFPNVDWTMVSGGVSIGMDLMKEASCILAYRKDPFCFLVVGKNIVFEPIPFK